MGFLPGFTYRQKAFIGSGTIISGDLTNSTNVVRILPDNDAFWAHQDGAGGKVRFASSDGETLLKFQEESFDATGKTAIFHVKISTLLSSADTEIYIYYGADTPSDGSNKEATWDDNFKAVYHLNQDQAEGAFDDATSNNVDLINFGTTDRAGAIGRGRNFDGINDFSDGGDVPGFKFGATGNFTLETIVKFDAMTDARLVYNLKTSGDLDQWGIETRVATDELEFVVYKAGYTFRARSGLNSIVTGIEYYVAATRTENGTVGTIYLDAIQAGTDSGVAKDVDLANNFNIGRDPRSIGYFDGMQDEITISNVARSLDWIKARNQSRLGTWLTFGPEETADIDGRRRRMLIGRS